MAQYGCKVRVGRPGRGVLEGVKLDFQGRDLLQVLLLPGDTTALSTLRLVTDPFNNYNKYRSKRKARECDRSSRLSSDQNTRSFPWSARPVAGNTLYLDPCGSAPGQGANIFERRFLCSSITRGIWSQSTARWTRTSTVVYSSVLTIPEPILIPWSAHETVSSIFGSKWAYFLVLSAPRRSLDQTG